MPEGDPAELTELILFSNCIIQSEFAESVFCFDLLIDTVVFLLELRMPGRAVKLIYAIVRLVNAVADADQFPVFRIPAFLGRLVTGLGESDPCEMNFPALTL